MSHARYLNTAFAAHTRSSSIEYSPSISSVLDYSPGTASFPFPRIPPSPMAGSSPGWQAVQSFPSDPYSLSTPPPSYLSPNFAATTPLLSPTWNPRVRKPAKFLAKSQMDKLETELVAEASATIVSIVTYILVYLPVGSLSLARARALAPAAEPVARRAAAAPFLAFIESPRTTPAWCLAFFAYVALIATFRTGVHRIALSLDPGSNEDNLEGAKGVSVQMTACAAAIGLVQIPMLVALRAPFVYGASASVATGCIMTFIIYEGLRKASNLEKTYTEEKWGGQNGTGLGVNV